MCLTPGELSCSQCGGVTRFERTFVTMWFGGGLNIIEDVPTHVCDKCSLQFYEAEIENEIRALVTAGFPAKQAVRWISVPVFCIQQGQSAVVALADDSNTSVAPSLPALDQAPSSN